MTPAIAIAVGIGAAALAETLTPSPFARWALYGLNLFPLFGQLVVQESLSRAVFIAAGEKRDLPALQFEQDRKERPIGVSNEALAAAVRRVTASRDPIYVAGEVALPVYWLADRRPASRYIFPSFMRPKPPYAAVARELERTSPAAIVVVEGYRVDYLDPVDQGRAPRSRAGAAGRAHLRPPRHALTRPAGSG